MSLANCQRCGKVFMRIKNPLCPDCQRAEDELFDKVVEYLKENPGATVAEVATALDVDVSIINKFVRTGRLAPVNPTWQARCNRCGIPISSGELCEQCRLQLASELSKELANKKEEKKERPYRKGDKIYLIDRVRQK